MNHEAAILEFGNRNEFRRWLEEHHDSPDGIWLVFTKGNRGFAANDALEESICFGWIDGVMKSIDEDTYRKYFSKRKNKEKWSDKNIDIFNRLRECGLMTEAGIQAFGVRMERESAVDKNEINRMNIEKLKEALMNDGKVYELFQETPPSRQKQLAGFYCDAKTEETRKKREAKIIDALRSGNKGMLY